MAAKGKTKIANQIIFALDIGTRSIIGIVGIVEDDRLKVIAIEQEEHTRRAMVDGQIEDIAQVAKLASVVKKRLENKLGFPLKRVSIAAAGRALLTQKGFYELSLPEARKINPDIVSRLEAGAINQAEEAFSTMEKPDSDRQFFLVGYSVLTYTLDNYNFSTILDHKGKNLKAEIIATFLPSEVVESLYTAMHKTGLEVASLTLEPIAAINASIPKDLRLLNLVMVDIGAGTSDIAACRDGGIIGYTMATLAGDEITEALMKQYLVDFKTAEELKFGLAHSEALEFRDILGFEHTVRQEEILECVREPLQSICQEIARQITELNNGAPSAVFLAGGGSKMPGLREGIVECLNMDDKRVAIVGNNFGLSAFSDEYDLNNPEYATPLGIAVSAGLNLISDSFQVTLNGKQAKLFKSGVFTIMDVLMMNGYGYKHLVSRSGRNTVLQLNGSRLVIHGEPSTPAVLMLNGENSKMTELIRAGDSIEFQPAVCGRDAEPVLEDILKPGYESVTVNGMIVPLNTPLNTGDVIEVEGYPETEEIVPPDTDEREKLENDFFPDVPSEYGTAEDMSIPMDYEHVIAPDAATGVSAAHAIVHDIHDTVPNTHVTAAGTLNTTPGTHNTAPSPHNTTPGSHITAPGSHNTAPGSHITAPGSHITAPDAHTTAPGSHITAPGSHITAPDAHTTAPGSHITAPGSHITAPGSHATVPGKSQDKPASSVTAEPDNTGKQTPESIPSPGTMALNITLNGTPLGLPRKPDGGAYLLMDILERSGLDFDHISGRVIITVNGKDSTFLQRLHSNDVVVIRCE